MTNRDTLIRSSARAVWLAAVANWAFGLAIVIGLTASLLLGARFTTLLLGAGPAVDLDSRTSGMRWLMILGIALAIAIYVLMRALARIITTVSAGDPFIADNAGRLRTIGWSLLLIQLLDIPAAFISRAFPALGAAAPDGGVSPAGWLAVLMTFVLAHIFAAGARMRDDLEGTV